VTGQQNKKRKERHQEVGRQRHVQEKVSKKSMESHFPLLLLSLKTREVDHRFLFLTCYYDAVFLFHQLLHSNTFDPKDRQQDFWSRKETTTSFLSLHQTMASNGRLNKGN